MSGGAGEVLRFWRRRRGISQLELATATGVSTKHLSFVENGRARPSRQLLVHLADALGMPLRERDRLLLTAGYAPPQGGPGLRDRASRPLRRALDTMLAAHDPHPAIAVDARWDLVAANPAADLLWDGVGAADTARQHAAAVHAPRGPAADLHRHPGVQPAVDHPVAPAGRRGRRRRAPRPRARGRTAPHRRCPPTTPVDRRRRHGRFRAQDSPRRGRPAHRDRHARRPLDVGAADLALELFLPADEDSTALLRGLAATRPEPQRGALLR